MRQYTILKWIESSGSEIEKLEFESDEAVKLYITNLSIDTEQLHTAEYTNSETKIHKVIYPQ